MEDQNKKEDKVEVTLTEGDKIAKISLEEANKTEETINIKTSEPIIGVAITESTNTENVELKTEHEIIDINFHKHPTSIDITVLVNTKPVEFHQPKATGAEIKTTAINQGVKIQQDFNLFEKENEGQPWKPVSDEQEVRLHDKQEFRAVAPDDNSMQ